MVYATLQVRVFDGVALQPLHTTVRAGGSCPFTFTQPFGDTTPVHWTVDGGDAHGTINADGLYQAPVVPGTYTVEGRAEFYATGSATVTVVSADVFGTGVAAALASLADAHAPGTPVVDPVNDVTGDGVVDDRDVALEVNLAQ